jgi:DNA invertase Pin-like site-specific DNA recombinase
MSNREKIQPTHLKRCAYIYVRQSSPGQVAANRESTDRQYKLVHRACALGWSKEQVTIVDEDQARSGDVTSQRDGFAKMTAEVALGRAGVILSIEVSRVARGNADWYRLLDLCGVTDTLIGDEDGLYHPGLHNDRLLLGLKGTMAEAELHVLRARLNGGILNKARRGELRRGLPIGLVWGEEDGEILFDPDEAVTGAIQTVFEKFAELGSARRVWLWFLSEKLSLPLKPRGAVDIQWAPPTYHAIYGILTHPGYAGAYTYGRTRQERYVDEAGHVRKRVRILPLSEWKVLIPDHHEGFINWETYEMNRARINSNTRPKPHQAGGAVREGTALLQGLATCGRCGRRLLVYYQGKNSTPGYYCANSGLVNGRGVQCLRVGGVRIDQAVSSTVLEAIGPAGIEAALVAEEQLEAEHESTIAQWRLQVERAQYEAKRAERRYQAVEPENRLVARTLETEWDKRLSELTRAQAELARREGQRPGPLTNEQREKIRALGADLKHVWEAPTTADRDRKELLRTLLEEVNITVERAESKAHLVLRWRGGTISELDVSLWAPRTPPLRTDESTIALVRRLAAHYPDAMIAGIVNRQGRRTVRGDRFTANKIGNLRRYWKIPRFTPPQTPPDGQLVNVRQAAEILNVAQSTLHRWLADGFIAGEQVTPGAPWRIRMTDELRARFVEEAPEGYVPIVDAMRMLRVSRQTVLQRVKRGELKAVHVRCGKRKGLRIRVIDSQPTLFDTSS